MTDFNLAVAETYYKALNNRDIKIMAQCLHSQIKFHSPMAVIMGKQAVLDVTEKFLLFFKILILREKFSAEDKVMVAYDLECPPPIGTFRTAALLTFKDSLIAEIELFYDSRLFDEGRE